jgi:hypothetical protein
VIALEAVVAREVALERGQDGDAQLVFALAQIAEPLLDVDTLGLAIVRCGPGVPPRREKRSAAHL